MLESILAYARGGEVDVRWKVIAGDEKFFRITKRIHNRLHGTPGDGGQLGPAEREIYEHTLAGNARELIELVRPGDVVYLHDPQTAGLIPAVRGATAKVVWRCHVGVDAPNNLARAAWEYLRPYVEQADAYVFSRRAFVWEGLDDERLWLVAPSIDAFSAKNQDLGDDAVAAILSAIGLRAAGSEVPPGFIRRDGTPGRVTRSAELVQSEQLADGIPLVTQVSRWDRLKDPMGVLQAFAEWPPDRGSHLVLAGPSTAGVDDDPEGAEVVSEVQDARKGLPAEARSRIHLAALPMDDLEENAAMVNALQRRATVVVQKSLAEGFGLTVAEAMWKARPVVASRVGGIQDQVVHGESGLLIDDPTDLEEFGRAVGTLIDDREGARAMGEAARERVRDHFLGTRPLVEYMRLLAGLLD
jgi:trehalose synthase